MQAFHALMQNKTVIMVAHRLSSITRRSNYLFRGTAKSSLKAITKPCCKPSLPIKPFGRNINRQNLGLYIENVMQSYFNPETQR